MKSRSDSIKKSRARTEECQEGEKEFFSRIFGSEFDEFPGKARNSWEIKYLTRSSSGGTTLSKKCKRDPRNRLAGRIKVEAFKSFKNILS
jgi:hypothetical protein